MTTVDRILSFVHDTRYDDLPQAVRHQGRRCLLDICGAAAGGRQTRCSQIIRDYAARVYGGEQASLWFDGRRCSTPGAALANAMSIDALDIHDSHRESLGHAGAHIFPTIMAVAEALGAGGRRIDGRELLTTLCVGYEVACRAGMALHATVSDYHTSGAWGAVSSAALYSRLTGLDGQRTRHALGIAEYYGPRSQMMRVIDNPTMLKDGSGWGAMAGVSAGMLAAGGFTGAPAVTVEADQVSHWWVDLGRHWEIFNQGFKVHATCWWAQPAIEAVMHVVRAHGLTVGDIATIRIETFARATHLGLARPETTDQAQYSVPFPVAAVVAGQGAGDNAWPGLGPEHLLEGRLNDPVVRDLARRIEMVAAPDLTDLFPRRFLARALIRCTDGRRLAGPEKTFRGENDHPLSDDELRAKYRWLAGGLISSERREATEAWVDAVADAPDLAGLMALLNPPPPA